MPATKGAIQAGLSIFASRHTTAFELRVAPEEHAVLLQKPLPSESAWRRPCTRRSTCPPCTWRSRLVVSALRDARHRAIRPFIFRSPSRHVRGDPERFVSVRFETHVVFEITFFFVCCPHAGQFFSVELRTKQISSVISTDGAVAALFVYGLNRRAVRAKKKRASVGIAFDFVPMSFLLTMWASQPSRLQ